MAELPIKRGLFVDWDKLFKDLVKENVARGMPESLSTDLVVELFRNSGIGRKIPTKIVPKKPRKKHKPYVHSQAFLDKQARKKSMVDE